MVVTAGSPSKSIKLNFRDFCTLFGEEGSPDQCTFIVRTYEREKKKITFHTNEKRVEVTDIETGESDSYIFEPPEEIVCEIYAQIDTPDFSLLKMKNPSHVVQCRGSGDFYFNMNVQTYANIQMGFKAYKPVKLTFHGTTSKKSSAAETVKRLSKAVGTAKIGFLVSRGDRKSHIQVVTPKSLQEFRLEQ